MNYKSKASRNLIQRDLIYEKLKNMLKTKGSIYRLSEVKIPHI